MSEIRSSARRSHRPMRDLNSESPTIIDSQILAQAIYCLQFYWEGVVTFKCCGYAGK